MTTRATFHSPISSRALLYTLFAALALVPVVTFAVLGVSSERFDIQGPGGPFVAFSAGLLSFMSPCVLPLVPVYLTNLSGATVENGRIVADRGKTVRHAMVFVTGFSIVFILLGVGAGLFGSYFFTDHKDEIARWAGLMMVLMGIVLVPAYGRASPLRSLVILGLLLLVFFFLRDVANIRDNAGRQLQLGAVLAIAWLRFAGYLKLEFLQRTMQFDPGRNRSLGYTRSGLVGIGFAFGWAPCYGPVLGSILNLGVASSSAWTATYLMVAYSAGLSIPFLIAAFAISDIAPGLRKMQRFAPYIEAATAVMVIGVGVLLWTGRLTGLNEFFDFGRFNEGL